MSGKMIPETLRQALGGLDRGKSSPECVDLNPELPKDDGVTPPGKDENGALKR
jgi:hypothetical protein